MSETTAQRRARQKAEVDKAIAPHFADWLDDLRENGLDRAYQMPALNEPVRITSTFGRRNIEKAKGGKASNNHQAIDFVPLARPQGRDVNVNSVVAGRVLYAGLPDDESGISVIVGGVDGKIYSYAHLEAGSLHVKAGDTVGRGESLGLMGDTGVTTAKCLHIVERVLKLGKIVDGKHDFDSWSWGKSKASGNRFVPADAMREALAVLEKELGGRALTFRDMEKTEPHVMWKKDPDLKDQFRGAMVADLLPAHFDHLRSSRDALPKGSPMYLALDAAVRAGARPLSDKDTQIKVAAVVAKPAIAEVSSPKNTGLLAWACDMTGDRLWGCGTKPVQQAAKPAAKPKDESVFASITTSIGSFVGDWLTPSPAKAAEKPVPKHR